MSKIDSFRSGDKRPKNSVRCNEQIRIPRVLLVQDGVNLGEMPTYVAAAKARDAGLDLVEVAPNARPPVCAIMDYGKFMYERSKKLKGKSQIKQDKEISFRYVIDEHDLLTKANQARTFLQKGHKVKILVKFKQREKAHKEKGFEAINKILELLQDVASLEGNPGYEGANIIARLTLKKDQ